MKTQSYKDLVVWQKGIALAKIVYRLTQNFPPEEKFGLVAQMAPLNSINTIEYCRGSGTPHHWGIHPVHF
jgi:hypothetical protein